MATEKQLAALAKARASRKGTPPAVVVLDETQNYQLPDEIDAQVVSKPPVRDERPDMTPEQLQARAEDFASAPASESAKRLAMARMERRFSMSPQLALTERTYVVGRRPMKIPGGVTLQPGEPVPGASGWPRLEGYVRTGVLKVAS